MSDSTGDSGIAFVRVQQRSNPDVQTYEAVPRVELAARLAEAVDSLDRATTSYASLIRGLLGRTE